MAKTTELKPDVGGNGTNSIAREAINSLLNPDPDKLSGLTRLPLDQVRPSAFARTFIDASLEQCRLSKESQKAYSENRKIWHSEIWEIENIGKRYPADETLNDDSFKNDKNNEKFLAWVKEQEEKAKKEDTKPLFFARGYKPEIVDVKTDPDFKMPRIKDSLVYKYLHEYFQARRSITPLFADGVIDLAKIDAEVRQPENENTPFRNQ